MNISKWSGWNKVLEKTWLSTDHQLCRFISPEERREKLKEELNKYHRHVGQYIVDRLRIYVCPACGRTVKQPYLSYYIVNTQCSCEFPTIYQMQLVRALDDPF